MRSTWRSAPPPSGTSAPSASSSRAPSAASMPAPPSVDALPPMARMIEVAPCSRAAAISSPVPRELARSASRCARGTRASPEARASSTTAVEVCRANAASTGAPSGPVTVTGTSVKPAAIAASSVPSPPSAIGTTVRSASASTERIPAATASPTPRASRASLNLSGATTIRIRSRYRFAARGRRAARNRRLFGGDAILPRRARLSGRLRPSWRQARLSTSTEP